jgi:hypothetical protein
MKGKKERVFMADMAQSVYRLSHRLDDDIKTEELNQYYR